MTINGLANDDPYGYDIQELTPGVNHHTYGYISKNNPEINYSLPVTTSDINLSLTLSQNNAVIKTWKIKAFPTGYRNTAKNALITNANLGSWATCQIAPFLLREFLGVTPNPYNHYTKTSTIIKATDTRLTHNCGANFANLNYDKGTCDATVPLYTFDKDSQASELISSPTLMVSTINDPSDDFAALVNSVAVSHLVEIRNEVQQLNIGGIKTFEWNNIHKTIVFQKEKSLDLFLAINKGSVNFQSIKYRYERTSQNKAKSIEVTVSAVLEDLYDFDYYSVGHYGQIFGVQKAVAFQIGQGRGVDNNGKIFVVRFEINDTFSGNQLIYQYFDPLTNLFTYKMSKYFHEIKW
jgi:hypothetical protein